MKPDRLEDELRAHYQAQHPSESLLGRMREVTELEGTAAEGVRRGYFIAAALAAMAAFVFWSSGWSALSSSAGQKSTFHAVAEEIALNHAGNYAPDFPSAEFSTIVASLDRLDFVPVLPEQAARLELVGARYCSLQGHIAAQLQLEDEAGNRFTLYQARRGERLGELVPTQVSVGTTRVEVWTEGELVLGLATTVETKQR